MIGYYELTTLVQQTRGSSDLKAEFSVGSYSGGGTNGELVIKFFEGDHGPWFLLEVDCFAIRWLGNKRINGLLQDMKRRGEQLSIASFRKLLVKHGIQKAK